MGDMMMKFVLSKASMKSNYLKRITASAFQRLSATGTCGTAQNRALTGLSVTQPQ